MSRGRGGAARCEDGVGEFEEGVAAAVETFVERAAEGLESIGRSHDATIMHSPSAFRILYLPAGLKRKLSLIRFMNREGGKYGRDSQQNRTT